MANFLEVIKMANFCVIKMANFFYQNGELFLSKWRISFCTYSQNGELFALAMKCLIGFTQKIDFLPKSKTVDLCFSKKYNFSQNKIYFLGLLQFMSRAKRTVLREIRLSTFVTRPLPYSGSPGPGSFTFR